MWEQNVYAHNICYVVLFVLKHVYSLLNVIYQVYADAHVLFEWDTLKHWFCQMEKVSVNVKLWVFIALPGCRPAGVNMSWFLNNIHVIYGLLNVYLC